MSNLQLERETSPPRGGTRARRVTSVVLLVAACASLLIGGATLYARQEIINSSAFAQRAIDAVHQPTVQRVITRELAVQVIEPAVPDALAVRPVISTALRALVTSSTFEPLIRVAAEQGHRLLFVRGGGNTIFDIADAGKVVASALKTLAPKVAARIPAATEAVLATLRKREFADTTLRIADAVRVLGFILPVVAVLLFALGIYIDRRRRRALTTGALMVAVTGIAFWIALELFRRYVVSHLYASGELTNADIRGAAGEVWGAYLGDLVTWTIVVTGLALVVVAAAAPLLEPYSWREGMRWARGRVARVGLGFGPQLDAGRVRAIGGVLLIVLGVFVIVDPHLALTVAAILAGCALIYIGGGELLSATEPEPAYVWRPHMAAPRRAIAYAGLTLALVAGILIAVAFTGSTKRARAGTVMACNGYPQLCGKRLDQVAFAGTHNSMSAADSPGWLIANQDRPVARQLDDGIRLFKISTHYATADSSGFVHTDIAAEGQTMNRVASKLDPSARSALQRLSASVTPGSLKGRKRDVWLCHTLCELGATNAVDFLSTIHRFLEVNPDQVIILFDEDYVSERDLRRAFKRSGLFPYLATLQPGKPLPTLAQLIHAKHNVVVFAQKPVSGHYPWNMDAFSFIQDTPLGATKASQFTCGTSRGGPNEPLLLMNSWADVFPPTLSPNLPLVKKSFIIGRARQCLDQRGIMPNLILTDFYDRGDVIGAVNELNGVAGQKPAAVEQVG